MHGLEWSGCCIGRWGIHNHSLPSSSSLKTPQFSINFHDNSRKKNRKIDFSFDSRHCASFIKTGAKLNPHIFNILSVDKLSGRHFVCSTLCPTTTHGDPAEAQFISLWCSSYTILLLEIGILFNYPNFPQIFMYIWYIYIFTIFGSAGGWRFHRGTELFPGAGGSGGLFHTYFDHHPKTHNRPVWPERKLDILSAFLYVSIALEYKFVVKTTLSN